MLVLLPAAAPSASAAAGCTAPAAQKLRFQPVITYTCDAAVGGGSTFTVKRVAAGALPQPLQVTVSGNTVSVEVAATLASAQSYRLTGTIDDAGSPVPVSMTWKTIPPPAHPKLSAEVFTAIPDPAAVHDMLQRLDAANVLAPPTMSHVVDGTGPTQTVAQLESRLKGRQVALVVGGAASWAFPNNLGAALAWFHDHGHGVVTAGQTHWEQSAGWSYGSAVGAQTAWSKRWAVFADTPVDPSSVQGGTLAGTSIVHHFLTTNLKSFTVVGPGSGAPQASGPGTQVLAYLRKNSTFYMGLGYPQIFLAARFDGRSRVVDLGYRPWAASLGGGFVPSASPGGALLARSLWWATNTIPPHTRFTDVPRKTSIWSTVTVGFTATDPDFDYASEFTYHFRVDSGRWQTRKLSGITLSHLAKGRYHTLRVYATDSGGNRDPKVATYRFFVTANAL